MEVYSETGEFSRNLFYIDTFAHGMRRSIGILVLKNGSECAIFDSGMPNSSNEILKSLKKLGIDLDSILYLFLTHRHIDHAGSSASLLEKLTNASVCMHPYSVKQLMKPSKIYHSGKEIFGDYATPMKPLEITSIRSLQDGEEINIGKEIVKAIHTPGHTSDHISYYMPSRRTLFCGDLIGLFKPKTMQLYPACMYPSFNYQKFQVSMEKISSIDLDFLVFSHFGVVMGNDSSLIIEDSLATHQRLFEIVEKHKDNAKKEELLKEIKAEMDASAIFPDSVCERAVEFMAKGFIEGLDPLKTS
jgi:glyoxylase-like metal-dependent hydrolase (beta-lactamase superfamily II)